VKENPIFRRFMPSSFGFPVGTLFSIIMDLKKKKVFVAKREKKECEYVKLNW